MIATNKVRYLPYILVDLSINYKITAINNNYNRQRFIVTSVRTIFFTSTLRLYNRSCKMEMFVS